MMTLEIKSLRVPSRIGVHAWEQKIVQTLLIDLVIPIPPVENDHIDSTLNYDLICQRITAFLADTSFALIETVAQKVAELIQQEFKVEVLSLTVSKPHAIKAADKVSVSIRF